MKRARAVLSIFALGIMFAAGVTLADWQGTSWMTNGAVIDATKIKANFDYIKSSLSHIETRASDPANPVNGQMWLRTDISPTSGGGGGASNCPVTRVSISGQVGS